jgi:molybdenum cofactor synthesis domain-containing protein
VHYTAAIITVSDTGSKGLREDTSGAAIAEIISADGWEIVYRSIVPDEPEKIISELIKCADELSVCLVLTTGGTGFSKRDITPEATKSVIDRETPGFAEVMRAESMKITQRGMLSRQVAGLRGDTLIINLPGSKKAAVECLGAINVALKHGIEMLRGPGSSVHPV